MPAPLIHDLPTTERFVATAAQVEFRFQCRGFNLDAIKVLRNGVLLTRQAVPVANNQYSVTLSILTEGGTIKLFKPSVGGDVITVYRQLPIERVTQFPETGPVPMSSVNLEFDRHIALIQELSQRALKLKGGDRLADHEAQFLKVVDGALDFGVVPKGEKGDPAPKPIRISWLSTAGQTRFPPTGPMPYSLDVEAAEVVVEGDIIEPEDGDWSLGGGTLPLIFTTPFVAGKRVTLHANRLIGATPATVSEQTFAVHEQRLAGDINDSGAVRRVRDAIAAAGGGRMYFEKGKGSRTDGDYLLGEATQNTDATNVGNLTSNLTIASHPRAVLWKDPLNPFMFFHNPVGIGTVAVPNVQGPTINNITFGAVTLRDDVLTLGHSEQEALVHLNGVENVVFNRTQFLAFRGDGVYLGAGDIGGGVQNRFNRRIIFRDIFMDGINKNNRNGVSIISAEGVAFEGVCKFVRLTRPGGTGAFNAFDPLTGAHHPGAVDVEPNAFTKDARLKDITGTIYVEDCGGSALARLLFGQDALTTKMRGFRLTPHALRCDHGYLNFFGGEGDYSGTDTTLIDPSATDCKKPFALVRGRSLRIIRPVHYGCTGPGEISYLDPADSRVEDLMIKDATFDACGLAGAVLRIYGANNWRTPGLLFRNCMGALFQVISAGTVKNWTYDMTIQQDAGAPTGPATTRFAVFTDVGTPIIDSSSVIDQSAKPSSLPDAVAWQVSGMFMGASPSSYAWKRGAYVRAFPTLEPGSPRGWLAIEDNATGAPPVFAVDARIPGGTADVAGYAGTVTATSLMEVNGGGRFTATRANQSLYTTATLPIGSTDPGAEIIYAMPYSRSESVYAGFAQSAAPAYYPAAAVGSQLVDIIGGVWFDGMTQVVREMQIGSANAVRTAPSFIRQGQVSIKVIWDATAGAPRVRFYTRLTAAAAFVEIPSSTFTLASTAAIRAFGILARSSDTLQLIKFGVP